jgi:hypothetical protein
MTIVRECRDERGSVCRGLVHPSTHGRVGIDRGRLVLINTHAHTLYCNRGPYFSLYIPATSALKVYLEPVWMWVCIQCQPTSAWSVCSQPAGSLLAWSSSQWTPTPSTRLSCSSMTVHQRSTRLGCKTAGGKGEVVCPSNPDHAPWAGVTVAIASLHTISRPMPMRMCMRMSHLAARDAVHDRAIERYNLTKVTVVRCGIAFDSVGSEADKQPHVDTGTRRRTVVDCEHRCHPAHTQQRPKYCLALPHPHMSVSTDPARASQSHSQQEDHFEITSSGSAHRVTVHPKVQGSRFNPPTQIKGRLQDIATLAGTVSCITTKPALQ